MIERLTAEQLERLEATGDDQVRRLVRMVRGLRTALGRYGMHDDDCALEGWDGDGKPPACTCGLDGALVAAQPPDIEEIDLRALYAGAFSDPSTGRAFIDFASTARLGWHGEPRAREVLQRGAPMIWLADRLAEIAPRRPALPVLFLVIAAEAVAKVAHDYNEQGMSKRHVDLFFRRLCAPDHRVILRRAFWDLGAQAWLSLGETLALVYAVRCGVVHEGEHVALPIPSGGADPGSPEPPKVTVATQMLGWHPSGAELRTIVPVVAVSTLRRIVLQGTVLTCMRMLTSR